MGEINVLVSSGKPVAAARKWQRCNEEMANYSPVEQKLMTIIPVEFLDDDQE
jgi:hypothetical protein